MLELNSINVLLTYGFASGFKKLNQGYQGVVVAAILGCCFFFLHRLLLFLLIFIFIFY